MTGNIINFKASKKRAGYAAKEAKAAANRKKFGRAKSEKCKNDFEHNKFIKHLDGHNLNDK